MTICSIPTSKTSLVCRQCDNCGHLADRRYCDLIKARERFEARTGMKTENDYCPNCAPMIKMSGTLSPTTSPVVRAKMSRNRRRNPDGSRSQEFISHGYRFVWCEAKQKYLAAHRVNMELDLGRDLTANEQVHHVDGDKLNNHTVNLYLCRDASHHNQVHTSLEAAAFALVRQGLIKFDATKGEYYV